MGQYFTNFGGEAVGSQPANTTTPWGTGSYSVNTSTFGYPVLAESHGGNSEFALYWNRIPISSNTDVEILWRGQTTFTENTGFNYQMESVLRGTGGNANKYGYTVNFLRALYTNFEGYNNNTSFTLGGGSNYTWAANTWYWMRARFEVGAGNTTTVRYKVWQDGTGEPGTWREEYADNRFSHDGWIGISAWQGSGTRYWSQVGIGWNGSSAPSSMPSAYTADSSLSSDSTLEASGYITRHYSIQSGTRDAIESAGVTDSTVTGATTAAKLDGTKHYGGLFTGIAMERGTRITNATFKFPLLAGYSGLGNLSTSSLYSYQSWAINTNYNNDLSQGTAGGTYYNTAQVQTGRALSDYPIAGTTLNDSAAQWQTVGAPVTSLFQEWLYSRMWRNNNTDFGVVIKGNGSAGNYIQPYQYDYLSSYGATLDVTEAMNTGYRNGSTVTTSVLGGTTWTNPSNVTATDGTNATTGSGSGGWSSDIIQLTNFGFTIPAGAVINGITVKIKGSGSNAADNVVRLIVGGTISGKNNPGGTLPLTTNTVIRGHAESTWNVNLTAADVNASNFGIAYAVYNTSGGGSATIDSIEMNIWYGESPKLYTSQAANNGTYWGSPTSSGLPFYLGGHTYFEQKITVNNAVQMKNFRYWLAASYFAANGKTGDPETNFVGQTFQLGIWLNETDLRAWTTGNALQTWNKTLTSDTYDQYDFPFTSAQNITAGTIIYVGIKLTGTSVNGFSTVYMNGDGSTDDPNSTSYFANTAPGGTWTSQGADLAYDIQGVIVPPPILGDSLIDANSDITVSGQVTKLGTPNNIVGNSFLINTIAVRTLDINQSTGGGTGSLPYGIGTADPKFGTSTDWRVGETFTPSGGVSNVSGIGFQTYGINATEQVIIDLWTSVAAANANGTPAATKTITLADNYNEGTGVGTQTWYDAFFTTPYAYSSGGLFFTVRRNQGAGNFSVAGYANSDAYAGGALYVNDNDVGTVSFRSVPTTYNTQSLGNIDLTFRTYYDANFIGSASVDIIEGDSSLTADGNRVIFGAMSETADSTLTVSGNITYATGSSLTADSDVTTSGVIIRLGVASLDADATLTAVGNIGYFVFMNYDSDSSLIAVGSKQFYADPLLYVGDSDVPDINAQRTAVTGASLVGDADAGVNSTGIEITHLAILKDYLYKIYDKNWNYLGIWKDVVSVFGYSQEINNAGAAISVTLARNSDSTIPQYDSLSDDSSVPIITDGGDELAAEMTTINSIGPGTNVDLNHNVKIYEFSTGVQPFDGVLFFTGYISMYTSKYGSTENTVVSVFSYGADLDNWVLTDNAGATRVSYLSKDPSFMLKNSLDSYNAAGGIIGYDIGTPGPPEVITNLITNPSFETNTTGWTASQGIGGRATDINGGAFGSYYYFVQNNMGSSVDYTTSNLVSGQQYRFSFYMKRPAAGGIVVHGAHNSTTVFDFVVSPPNTWTRYDISFTATAAAPLFISFSVIGSDNQVYIDAVMLTQGATLYDYFDGDTTDSNPLTTFAWTGTAHASTSTRSTILSYIGATIEDTGSIATYTFNVNTELEVIKKALELAPTDWFFYTDLATNKLHFHPRPSTPKHYFYLGKHVLGLDLEKTIEGIVNDVIFTGGKPTNLALDRFFGTQGTVLSAHSGEIDSSWTKHPSSAAGNGLVITDANRVRPSAAGEQLYMVSANSPSSDYELEVDYFVPASGPASGDIGLAGRVDPTALTYYLARIWNDNNVQLYKCIAGAYTLLQQAPMKVNLAPGQTRNMKFKMNGAQLTVTVDGTAYVDLEDRSIIYGTRGGVRSGTPLSNETTGLHVDNFQMRLLDQADAIQVFKRYTNPTSITNYRRGLARVTDNRVTRVDSADIIVGSQINRNKDPRYRSNITISGSTYDIRSIKLGDLVAFRNFDNFVDTVQMQVVRIDYTGDHVVLQLDTLLPSVPKRLEDIKRNLAQAEVADNPNAPST